MKGRGKKEEDRDETLTRRVLSILLCLSSAMILSAILFFSHGSSGGNSPLAILGDASLNLDSLSISLSSLDLLMELLGSQAARPR